MKKIYVVSVWEGYDWHEVLGVYDDMQKAKNLAEMIDGSCTEHEINSFEPDVPPAGKEFIEIEMKKDGRVSNIWYKMLLDDHGKRHKSEYSLRAQNKYPWHEGLWRLTVSCYAKEKKEVIDIANMIRKQLLADPNKPKMGVINTSL